MSKKTVRKNPPRSQKRATKPARQKPSAERQRQQAARVALGTPDDSTLAEDMGAEALGIAAQIAKHSDGGDVLRRLRNALDELAPSGKPNRSPAIETLADIMAGEPLELERGTEAYTLATRVQVRLERALAPKGAAADQFTDIEGLIREAQTALMEHLSTIARDYTDNTSGLEGLFQALNALDCVMTCEIPAERERMAAEEARHA